MRSMDCESATAFLVEKITEAMDIVAPFETKDIRGNTMNTWKTKAINITGSVSYTHLTLPTTPYV